MRKFYSEKTFPAKHSRWRGFLRLAWVAILLAGTAAGASAQDTSKMSFRYENVALLDVLKDLNQRTGLKVMFKVEEVTKETDPVIVDIGSATLLEGLTVILRGRNLRPLERNGQVIISPIADGQQRKPPLRIIGTVKDQWGEPLAGATVLVKGTTTGVSADAQGKYAIVVSNPQGNVVLVFELLGKETAEVRYTGQAHLDVVLEESLNSVEEVIVTGVIDKPRESYTGAVVQITRKELEMSGHRSLLKSIQNIDPGFFIVDNNNVGSDPNAMPDINIRGTTSFNADIRDVATDMATYGSNMPIFVLDGFEINIVQVMDMDQSQVDEILIFKDAIATSMYGARGANGVVMIVSRRALPGRLKVSYNGSLNIEQPSLGSYNLMNAAEKLQYEVAAGLYQSGNAATQMQLNTMYNNRLIEVLRGVDTYWLNYPVRTGIGQKHSIRLEGGRDDIIYSAGITYNNVMGVMKGSDRNTLSGNMMLNYKNNNVNFQNTVNVNINNSSNSPYGTFSDYTTKNSYLKPYDDDGNLLQLLSVTNYGYYIGVDKGSEVNVENPLWNATLPSKSTTGYTMLQDNMQFQWDILKKKLIFRASGSYTHTTNRTDEYVPVGHTSFEKNNVDFSKRGTYRLTINNMTRFEGNARLNYSDFFNGVHMLSAGLNFNIGGNNAEGFTINGEGISNPNRDFLGAATTYPDGSRPNSTESVARNLGGTASVNYTYDQRYFADATLSTEGSSRFGGNNRQGTFGAVGIGWNLYHESFIKDRAKAISMARLKFSYGTSGSQNFNPYQAMTTYGTYGTNHYNGWSGSYIYAMGNEDLGWQITHTYNLGVMFGMFNNKISLNADLYSKISENLLAPISLPSGAGFTSYTANIGELSNLGAEVRLNLELYRNHEKRIRWAVGWNMVHNKNTIRKISESMKTLNEELKKKDNTNPSMLYEEGQAMGTLYVVRSAGIDPSTGKEVFYTKEGTYTETWSSRDQVAFGSTNPLIWGNANTSFRYGKFSLYATFGYSFGSKQYNSTLASKVENVYPWQNLDRRAYTERWKQPGDNARFKGINDMSTTYATSRLVMKDNYISCNSISVSFEDYSPQMKKKYGIARIYVSVHMEDVFRISTIKQERGIYYPYSKKFSLSINLGF